MPALTVILIIFAGTESRSLLRGDFEWDEWLWTTYSNKTWLWAFSMGVIGGCVGFISYRFYKRVGKRDGKES